MLPVGGGGEGGRGGPHVDTLMISPKALAHTPASFVGLQRMIVHEGPCQHEPRRDTACDEGAEHLADGEELVAVLPVYSVLQFS